MFTQSIKFYPFQCHIIKITDEKCEKWDLSNTHKMNGFNKVYGKNFTEKFEFVFVSTQENAFP